VYIGTGNGAFAPRVIYGATQNPRMVALGDLNKDGHLDVVTGNNGGSVSRWLGNGSSGLGSRVDVPVSPVNAIALGDVNGDGDLDLVAITSSNTVTILLGDGLGGLAVAHDYPTLGYPYSVQLGDLNLDGHPDIVVGGGNPYGTYGHAISV